MTFLNAALAFGAAAFLIPLAIHILNRSRFKTVDWGAMHLLESVIKINHKRFRFDQWILLALRCAIPILLAFCLARPVLTGMKILAGESPVSMVVLLDSSYSMETESSDGTRFKTAVDAAKKIIAATPRGSEISVIQTGGKATPLFPQPVFDSSIVVRKADQMRAGFGACDMPAALAEGLATLAEMKHARREMIVISDFQPADWQPVEGSVAQSIRSQIEAASFAPELSLIAVGKTENANLSVDSLEIPQRAIGIEQQLLIRANLRNHGPLKVDDLRVSLSIDGQEKSVSHVSLPPNGTIQTLFPCVFDTPGSHVIQVRLIADDPLQVDNSAAAAVTVWDTIRVLLVDGDPRSEPLMSETDFLAVALSPYTFGRVRLADLVQTTTVQANKIDTELLADTHVLVLANVAKLTDAALQAVQNHVSSGGALLVCGGDRIDLNWYEERGYDSGNGILPAPFGLAKGIGRGTAQTTEPQAQSHLINQHFDHAALEFFNNPANGDLSQAVIRRWHELAVSSLPKDSDPSQGDVTTLARLDSGDPFLLERRFGKGVVLQLATACDADWSDLPLQPIYVPLMQQLITTMASSITPPRNLITGEPAVMWLSDTASDSSISVTSPDGGQHLVVPVQEADRTVARFASTERPGIYSISLPSAETIHFVAKTDRKESELAVLDHEQLVELSDELDAGLIESADEYLSQDRLRRHGREIWKYLLAVVLAFMFLELVLQQRFSRVST